MQSEFSQYGFGVVRQLLEFVVRSLGTRELYQFDLLKLVLADNSAHVFAVRSGLAAKTGSIGSQRNRQARRVQHFISIEVGHRNFGRRNQPEILLAVGYPKQVLCRSEEHT